ncbi:hypothetical protein HYH03_007603 [Edaphochlamys debaryana]|uniref:Haloacid dehalogenase-like hydrolase domain-containing protein 3 n=1 Tax=Edaphochlamys debaryana TaxID=47281 RepID=A0A836C093_9CHLO|nr:hypothetical protein HYH03_007603 [Edaphochlamys debaryana]|eukprot:KAG2494248.1 hypothetical protein HYH03_007603 [Edaphochlamys debaryana]
MPELARSLTPASLSVDLLSGRSHAPRHHHKPLYRAVLVDAAGTFLIPSEPVSDVYLRYAKPAGCTLGHKEVLHRFRRAYNMPWSHSPLRYVGDARPFWSFIVRESTGCSEPEVHEAIYEYYARAEAWHVAPGAVDQLRRLKDAGLLLAVVSNFDTRLRPILRQLGVEGLFDEVVVSAEVCAEKPNPVIFDAALRSLSAAAVARGTASALPFAAAAAASPAAAAAARAASAICASLPPPRDFRPLAPEQVVHIGDDRRNDCWGARAAGMTAWLWGADVHSWGEVADRVLHGERDEEEEEEE